MQASKQQREQERELQTLELKQEEDAYQAQSAILCTSVVSDPDAVRMAQALAQNTEPADDGTKVSQLQDEIFALGVKDLQMDRQAQWQQDMETECSLGKPFFIDYCLVKVRILIRPNAERTLADMQAFATDLDSLLAQFGDAP